MAHQSRWVFQLRGLDTGSAKDVSGVIRVSKGGDDQDEIPSSASTKELLDAEWLYQLKGDGSVRVWGRGE
jgi:elongator complex protein 6